MTEHGDREPLNYWRLSRRQKLRRSLQIGPVVLLMVLFVEWIGGANSVGDFWGVGLVLVVFGLSIGYDFWRAKAEHAASVDGDDPQP